MQVCLLMKYALQSPMLSPFEIRSLISSQYPINIFRPCKPGYFVGQTRRIFLRRFRGIFMEAVYTHIPENHSLSSYMLHLQVAFFLSFFDIF